MAAIVDIRSARARAAPETGGPAGPASPGWGTQERAEIVRAAALLGNRLGPLETADGLTDRGEPWAVLAEAETGEVVAHFARIDGRFVASLPQHGITLDDAEFRRAVDRTLAAGTEAERADLQDSERRQARIVSLFERGPAAIALALAAQEVFDQFVSEALAAAPAPRASDEVGSEDRPALLLPVAAERAPPERVADLTAGVLMGARFGTKPAGSPPLAGPVPVAAGLAVPGGFVDALTVMAALGTEAVAQPPGRDNAVLPEPAAAGGEAEIPDAEPGLVTAAPAEGPWMPAAAGPGAKRDGDHVTTVIAPEPEGSQIAAVAAEAVPETARAGSPVQAAKPDGAPPASTAPPPEAGDTATAAALQPAEPSPRSAPPERAGADHSDFDRLDFDRGPAVIDLTLMIATDDLLVRIDMPASIAILDAHMDDGFRFAALRMAAARPEVRAKHGEDAVEAREGLFAALREAEAPDRLFRTEGGAIAVRAEKADGVPDAPPVEAPGRDFAMLAQFSDAPPVADGFWL